MGGHAGAELLQDVHCDVSETAQEHCGVFGAGVMGKPLSSRTCQSLLVDCTFPLEGEQPSGDEADPPHQSKCDMRVDTPYEPYALWSFAPHCNLSPHPLVLEGLGTNVCTWLLLVHCSYSD